MQNQYPHQTITGSGWNCGHYSRGGLFMRAFKVSVGVCKTLFPIKEIYGPAEPSPDRPSCANTQRKWHHHYDSPRRLFSERDIGRREIQEGEQREKVHWIRPLDLMDGWMDGMGSGGHFMTLSNTRAPSKAALPTQIQFDSFRFDESSAGRCAAVCRGNLLFQHGHGITSLGGFLFS